MVVIVVFVAVVYVFVEGSMCKHRQIVEGFTENSVLVPPQQRQVGSIADYDPLNGNWGSVGSSRAAEKIGLF